MMRKILISTLMTLALAITGLSASKAEPIIKVAVSPASPPMLYEQAGKIMGADLEIFTAYCKQRGCTLKMTSYDWQGMLDAVTNGKADVAFSAISITNQRKQVMDFSEPYFNNTWHLVALNKNAKPITDLTTLKQYRIGYPRGMAYDDLITNELEPKGYYSLAKVRLYPSYNEVMTELQQGNLELAFVEEPVLLNFQNKFKLPVQSVYAFSGRDVLGFAFSKGSALRDDFNKFLAELGPKRINEIITNASK